MFKWIKSSLEPNSKLRNADFSLDCPSTYACHVPSGPERGGKVQAGQVGAARHRSCHEQVGARREGRCSPECNADYSLHSVIRSR